MSEERFDRIDEKLDTLASHVSALYASHQKLRLLFDDRHTIVLSILKTLTERVDRGFGEVDAGIRAVDVKIELFADTQRAINHELADRDADYKRGITALENQRR